MSCAGQSEAPKIIWQVGIYNLLLGLVYPATPRPYNPILNSPILPFESRYRVAYLRDHGACRPKGTLALTDYFSVTFTSIRIYVQHRGGIIALLQDQQGPEYASAKLDAKRQTRGDFTY